MKSGYLVAGACALSLACGYIAGKAGGKSDAATSAATSPPTRPERSSSRESRPRSTGESDLLDSILAGRAISEIPPADLAALIARLSKFDPGMDPLTYSKQQYQLQLLLAKLSAADLTALATAIQSDPEAKKANSIHSVLTALAGKDPDRALGWLSTQESNPGLHSMVIGAIAKDDPQAAADLLREAMMDGTLSNNNLWAATYGIGQAMAKLGVDPLLAFVDSLPRQQQSNVAMNVFRQIPEGERIRFLDEIYRRNQDGRFPGMSADHIFSNILSTDEARATEWFSKLPDGDDKNSLYTSAASNLLRRGDREAATKWMSEALAASPGKEKEILGQAFQSMSYSNPEGIPLFARLLPEGQEFTAKDLENHALNALNNDAGTLITIASAIQDPGEQARLIAGAFERSSPSSGRRQNLNANDLEILTRRIAAMGFTGENATLVNDALEAARNPANPADE